MTKTKRILKKVILLNFDDLKELNPSDYVKVNYDDFFDFFPKILKASPENSKSNIRKIYEKYMANTSTKIASPNDTIKMKVNEAILYFDKVKYKTNSYTFSLDNTHYSLWD